MADPRKDIYGSHEPHRADDEDQEAKNLEHPWLDQVFSTRWSTTVILVILIAFLGVLGLLIHVQRQQLIESRGRDIPGVGGIEMAPPPRTGMEIQIDASGRLVLDEIEPQMDEKEAGTTPQALTPKWVMQAAFNLRQAQRAYSEMNWETALKEYTTALNILPSLQGVREKMGLCHLRMSNFVEAEKVFAAEIESRPRTPGLLNNLGVAQMGQGKNAEAEALFREAMVADPRYLPAQQNLALLYYRTDRLDVAADAYDAVLRQDPGNSEATLMFAAVRMKQEKWEEAAEVLTEYVRTQPQVPPAYFRLAEARAKLGDPAGAMSALSTGLDLVDVRTALIWLNRKEFDVLRGNPEFQRRVETLTEVMK